MAHLIDPAILNNYKIWKFWKYRLFSSQDKQSGKMWGVVVWNCQNGLKTSNSVPSEPGSFYDQKVVASNGNSIASQSGKFAYLSHMAKRVYERHCTWGMNVATGLRYLRDTTLTTESVSILSAFGATPTAGFVSLHMKLSIFLEAVLIEVARWYTEPLTFLWFSSTELFDMFPRWFIFTLR